MIKLKNMNNWVILRNFKVVILFLFDKEYAKKADQNGIPAFSLFCYSH